MRIWLYILLATSALLSLVSCFTKEDYEIFRLRDELEVTEGKEVTFYGETGTSTDMSSH